ncbi:hypothetical protein P153DRAFT_281824 [Dothidotthia symphoricarpi CBS 119687]|uniref:O-methyltransferase family protein n=1 Tax=Dothidotthia symphoricarpi CBS 119687 TaxID=1392245 RepID=A0A6A6ARM4_9PLEO|nr:uncharacterized protein P153DRAFT_281824 [Dothidotthia symphoricarpi CBS 119687]KAF2133645.1 hypothetical protein P153DRAFT_281824 [Dothidotthia symphoricarpi CBS 119687]
MPDASSRATRSIGATMTSMQTLLFQLEPTTFLQHLATQNQLLACLQWLGEFQVLAYVPLVGSCSVLIKDLADLADVPEAELYRVVRIMALAGFLQEPQPGYIEHTALSASFVSRPAHLDAAMFMAETVAPSALHMAAATRRHAATKSGAEARAAESAYTVALRCSQKEPQTFQSALVQRKRLQRQWPAYLSCVGDCHGGATDILGQLDWPGLGNACVVDVGGPSTRKSKTGGLCPIQTLAEHHPALRFVIQTDEPVRSQSSSFEDPTSRISVHKRANGTQQTIKDAAVYLIRLSTPTLTPIRTRILSELQAHLRVLEANKSALLVLTPRLLPEPSAVDVHVESMARLRDLSLLQLANDGDLTMQELMDLVDSVHDCNGRLVVVKKLSSRNIATVALGIRYQTNTDRQHQLSTRQ